MAEFVANNNYFICIKLSLFFALRKENVRISFYIIDCFNITTCQSRNKRKAIDITESMKLIWKYIHKLFTKALYSRLNQVNKYEKAICYIIWDEVWLSIKNINSNELWRKSDYKMFNFLK